MKKDFVEELKEMLDIIDQQTGSVGSYVKQINSCIENITTGRETNEMNGDVAAVSTRLLMRLNKYKLYTKALSVISRKLERYVHNLIDECFDALEIPEN